MNKNLFTERILKMGYGFWESQVLFTAINIGIFDLLERQPLTGGEVSEKVGASSRGIELLLRALASLEFIEKEKNNKYKNALISSAYLIKEKPKYKGYVLLHFKNMWDTWGNLEKAVLTGKPVVEIRQKLKNEDCSELFTLAMQSNAVEMADTISNALEMGKYSSMLDLGGGPATYSIAFARKNEKLKVTLLDIPQVIKIAKRIVDKNKLTERFTFIEGDFFEVECGKGYDFIYISNIIHQYSPDENLTFLKNVSRILIKGGDLVINDFFLDDTGISPPFSAVFGLNMLVHTDGGRSYTFLEVENWLNKIGFNRVEKIAFNEAPSALLIATK